MITEEIIKKIMNGCQGPNLAKHLLDNIQAIENIENNITNLKRQINVEIDEHKQKIDGLKNKIIDCQKSCPHWETTFHCDPSGNNDSYRTCNICGKDDV